MKRSIVCIQGPLWIKDRLLIPAGEQTYAWVDKETSKTLWATTLSEGLPVYINRNKYEYQYIKRKVGYHYA